MALNADLPEVNQAGMIRGFILSHSHSSPGWTENRHEIVIVAFPANLP
jgi:hypothetical protein